MRNDRKPEGFLDPEQVGEAASSTFRELRARVGELRFVEGIEQQLLGGNSAHQAAKDSLED